MRPNATEDQVGGSAGLTGSSASSCLEHPTTRGGRAPVAVLSALGTTDSFFRLSQPAELCLDRDGDWHIAVSLRESGTLRVPDCFTERL